MQKQTTIILALIPGSIVTLAAIVGGLLGYRLNVSPSMPMGLWHKGGVIEKGGFVSACITADMPMAKLAFERHYLSEGICDNGFAPLLKEVRAVPGDLVTVEDKGITVNGQAIPNTATKPSDSMGRPMQFIARGSYKVTADEYWLIANDHPRSFDSRYFGPVNKQMILYAMRPVWTTAKYSEMKPDSKGHGR